MIDYMNSFNNQNVAVFFDLAPRFRSEKAFAGRNLARFQRAAKGAGQSAGCRSNHVIQGRGLRFMYTRIHPVVFGNFRMHTKLYRIFHLG
jgi:hypothetical protein